MKKINCEVAILGAGFAGSVLAHSLSKKGIGCVVIDRKEIYPDIFRAEKIELNQSKLYKKLGVFDYVIPKARPVGSVELFRFGVKSIFDASQQYGFRYSETVNNFRKNFPDSVKFIVDKIDDIQEVGNKHVIKLNSGGEIHPKLTILATGGNGVFLEHFGMTRQYDDTLRSLSIGFDVDLKDASILKHNGFNYYNETVEDQVEYLTLFKMGDGIMRVNIFTQWRNNNPDLALFRNETMKAVDKYFPNIQDHIGDYQISSKVQIYPTKFYRLKNKYKSNVVVIGDEHQSVSPATGTGLSKIGTELDRLTDTYIPLWLEKGTVKSLDLWAYYHDAEKLRVDLRSRSVWCFYRALLAPQYSGIYRRVLNRLAHFRIKFF